MTKMNIEPEALEGVRKVTAGGGWTVELDHSWREEAVIRLTSAPRGRGVRRDRWLIVAPTFADCFYALTECLYAIEGRPSRKPTGLTTTEPAEPAKAPS